MEFKGNYKVYSRYYKKIRPIFRKPKVKAYTMLVLSLFTMSFFGVFAIRPTLKTIVHLQKEIKDKKLVKKALEEKIVNLSLAKEEYRKIENDLSLISKALPREPQFSSLLKDLETLAQETGVTISAVRLEEIKLTEKNQISSKKISSSLNLSGSYPSCKDFLNRLLNSTRIYTISDFEVRSNSKEERGVVKLDLKINTYYLSSSSYVQ